MRDIVAKELENVLTSFDKIKTYLDVDKNLRDVMLYDVDFCRRKVMDIRGKL